MSLSHARSRALQGTCPLCPSSRVTSCQRTVNSQAEHSVKTAWSKPSPTVSHAAGICLTTSLSLLFPILKIKVYFKKCIFNYWRSSLPSKMANSMGRGAVPWLGYNCVLGTLQMMVSGRPCRSPTEWMNFSLAKPISLSNNLLYTQKETVLYETIPWSQVKTFLLTLSLRFRMIWILGHFLGPDEISSQFSKLPACVQSPRKVHLKKKTKTKQKSTLDKLAAVHMPVNYNCLVVSFRTKHFVQWAVDFEC